MKTPVMRDKLVEMERELRRQIRYEINSEEELPKHKKEMLLMKFGLMAVKLTTEDQQAIAKEARNG